MALKITRASEPIEVERLIMVVYAAPGVGKTSLAFTAHKPLLLDFDGGAYRAANRGDAVQVSAWADIESMTADDLKDYHTVIMDTAGRALDALSADIIRKNPKMGNGGSLSLRGFGELKSRFTAFLRHLTSFGKDVVLISHMDEQRSGDDIIERLDIQGGSKNEIYKIADVMGRLGFVGTQRQLRFSPTDTSFGKNPAQLAPLDVPDMSDPSFPGFLAGVLTQIKERLNQLTEDQRAAQEEQQWFAETLPKVKDPEGINALIERAKAGGKATSVMLNDRANELGLEFDQKAKAYLVSEAA